MGSRSGSRSPSPQGSPDGRRAARGRATDPSPTASEVERWRGWLRPAADKAAGGLAEVGDGAPEGVDDEGAEGDGSDGTSESIGDGGLALLERLESVEHCVRSISQVLGRAASHSASPPRGSPLARRGALRRPAQHDDDGGTGGCGCCDVCGVPRDEPDWHALPRLLRAALHTSEAVMLEDSRDTSHASLMEQSGALVVPRRRSAAQLPAPGGMLHGMAKRLKGWKEGWDGEAAVGAWTDAASDGEAAEDEGSVDEPKASAALQRRQRPGEAPERRDAAAWTHYLQDTEPRKGRFRWPMDVRNESEQLRSAATAAKAKAVLRHLGAAGSGGSRTGRRRAHFDEGAAPFRGRYADILAAAVEA